MSSPSREHLLGYLLGALERTEHEQVDAEVQSNPELRDELRRLESLIGCVGLADEPAQYDPPAGLAVQTCRLVALQAQAAVVPASREWAGAPAFAGQRNFAWTDLLTAVAVLIAAAALFFPALNHSLEQAEVAACQNHLRQIGLALHEYSSLEPSGSFPRIELAGNRGVAGAYAPILVGQQLVLDSRVFLCPSSGLTGRGRNLHIPTPEELDKAAGEMLANFHQNMGGDYGYNMGYTQDGDLVAPRNASRPEYVLLADAPSDSQPGRRSANHRGRGQNVLYEDGRVQFIGGSSWPEVLDDPFHNRAGRVAAGLDASDHVLGASCDRPVPLRRSQGRE